MPPKRKTKAKEEAPENVESKDQTTAKNVSDPVKTESKPQPTKTEKKPDQPKEKKVQQKPAETKPTEQPVKKADQPKSEAKLQQSEIQPQSGKINSDQQNLTDDEILRRRKLRFNGIVGTEMPPEQAEKIRLQRLEKFGGIVPPSKEEMQKRKMKFSNNPPLENNEDPETLKKRSDKFGGGQDEIQEDKAVLNDRKKKFGGNDVCLDDEIQKAKEKRQQNKGTGNNQRNFTRDRFEPKRNQPFRRDNNSGRPQKKVKR